MEDDAVLVAIGNFAASLANGGATSTVGCQVTLPGHETEAKKRLEVELQNLAIRTRHLEGSASVAVVSTLPPTPSESNDTLFGSNSGASYGTASRPSLSHTGSGETDNGNPTIKRRRLEHEAPGTLQELQEPTGDEVNLHHGQSQGEHHKLTSVTAQLPTQMQLRHGAIETHEEGSVAELEKELLKYRKANEAFQKVLREIGQIVTAVARGDLTMKVQMNADELDPEINTFKLTINDMMDQLQTFAREVSRVAREVGTEGLLGGQAIIDGIDGTWKELTDNGKLLSHLAYHDYYL